MGNRTYGGYTLIIAVGLLALVFGTATTAQAATCQGQIRQGISPATPARPNDYFTSWTIDGEWTDMEYVFVFRPVWSVNGVDRLIWTGSSPIRDTANRYWSGTLGARACLINNIVYVYADAGAVLLSGGPSYWQANLRLYRY